VTQREPNRLPRRRVARPQWALQAQDSFHQVLRDQIAQADTARAALQQLEAVACTWLNVPLSLVPATGLLPPGQPVTWRGRPVGVLQLPEGADVTEEQRAVLSEVAAPILAELAAEEALAQLERDLRQREAELTTLLDLLPIGVAYCSADLTQLRTNPAADQIAGAGSFSPTRPPDVPSRLLDARTYQPLPLRLTPLRQALAGVETPLQEFVVHSPQSAQDRWVRLAARPVRFGGEITGAFAVFIDATAEVAAHQLVFEALTCGVLVHGPAGQLLFANRAAARLLGASDPGTVEEMLARSVQPVPADAALPWEVVRTSGREAATGLLVLERAGRPVYLEVMSSPVWRPDGVLDRVVSTLIDVTANWQARETLAASEHRLRVIFEQAAIGIAVLDQSGRITAVNRRLQQFLQREEPALLGLPFVELVHPGTAFDLATVLDDLRQGRAEYLERELCFLSATGALRWGRATVIIVRDERGEHWFFTCVEDVTPQREAESRLEAMLQAEKLRALGQMASGVAHDLNQYLGLISGHSELVLRELERGTLDPERLREALGVVIQAAMDGAEAVRRLQSFGRGQPGSSPQRVDLGELLREIAKLTAPKWRDAPQQEGRPITLHVETESDLVIEGWPEELREALTNLVFNAVDAMPRGGTIRLASNRSGDEVEVLVADDGVGMPPEVQRRVFEPFFTTKGDRGSGLGLSIVYATVERHRGRIALTSAPGSGTTFRLLFPAAPSPHPAAASAPPPVSQRRLHALAVDDDPALARMLALMLESDGHTVTVALSGEEALRLLATTPVDLVISDLGMGTGMNGWELAEHVRQRFPDLPVVFATGWGSEIDSEEARRRGIAGIISKPYRLHDLRRLLAQLTC